jgi:GTP pyrophosphokinase
MVTVVQLHPASAGAALEPIAEGLEGAERALLARALEFAEPLYAGQRLSTGEAAWAHALGLAAGLASVGLDAPGRAAGVLFAAPKYLEDPERLQAAFGAEIAGLAAGVEKLYQLRVATRDSPTEQNEVLRKMVLGMAEDVRVVLIRLASRTQTLRWFSKNESPE